MPKLVKYIHSFFVQYTTTFLVQYITTFFIEYFPSMLSGFLLTLAFPKANLPCLAWIALVPLMLYLHKVNFSIKRTFNAGFIMGFCHFISLIYWIVPTISIYGQISIFLAVPILFLLASYLALYPALFALGLNWFGVGYKNIKEKSGYISYIHNTLIPLIAAMLWVALEYIRSTLFTGFPWGVIGYSQYMNLNLIQIADITSVYGISFMIVMTNAVVAKAMASIFVKRLKADVVIWVVSLVIIFGIIIGYGKTRIESINKASAESESVNISVIQGNIEQVFKWEATYQESTIKQYCQLSIQAVEHFQKQFGAYSDQKNSQKTDPKIVEQLKPDLIIWPETALPFYYSWNKKMSAEVDECIKDADTTFLIGSPAFKIMDKNRGDEKKDDKRDENRSDDKRDENRSENSIDGKAKSYNFFNRAYMVNKVGVITGSYDKVHLVPFGEYVPFGKYLSFLGKIIAQAGDFSSGKTDSVPLAFNGSSAGVLICFEIIFPYLARTAVNNGAEILVTMTNDAWFGYTSAPKQHFTMAVFRAIENRRALARAANTGISGFIDPTGKIIQASQLFEECALIQMIPSMKIQTVYSKFGDIFAFICLIGIGVSGILLGFFRTFFKTNIG